MTLQMTQRLFPQFGVAADSQLECVSRVLPEGDTDETERQGTYIGFEDDDRR